MNCHLKTKRFYVSTNIEENSKRYKYYNNLKKNKYLKLSKSFLFFSIIQIVRYIPWKVS